MEAGWMVPKNGWASGTSGFPAPVPVLLFGWVVTAPKALMARMRSRTESGESVPSS